MINENYDVVDLTTFGLGVIICNNDSLWSELSLKGLDKGKFILSAHTISYLT